METIGIINLASIKDKLDLFNEEKDFMAYSEYKNKISNEIIFPPNYIEVVDTLTQLRQNLIETSKNTSTFKIELKDNF